MIHEQVLPSLKLTAKALKNRLKLIFSSHFQGKPAGFVSTEGHFFWQRTQVATVAAAIAGRHMATIRLIAIWFVPVAKLLG